MGACDFVTESRGKDAHDAFTKAIEKARYEYGHGGYTGTIAEKHAFNLITCPVGTDAYDYAHNLMDTDDERVVYKWGPAGCIELPSDGGERCFLFFGIASS